METRLPYSRDPHDLQIHQYLVIFKAALMDFVVEDISVVDVAEPG
jgi:hypothetical protein